MPIKIYFEIDGSDVLWVNKDTDTDLLLQLVHTLAQQHQVPPSDVTLRFN